IAPRPEQAGHGWGRCGSQRVLKECLSLETYSSVFDDVHPSTPRSRIRFWEGTLRHAWNRSWRTALADYSELENHPPLRRRCARARRSADVRSAPPHPGLLAAPGRIPREGDRTMKTNVARTVSLVTWALMCVATVTTALVSARGVQGPQGEQR